MMAAARDMFAAATPAALTLDHRSVPLADVAAAWGGGDGERIIFTTA